MLYLLQSFINQQISSMILPGIVSEIRGKLGDKIYSRNSFGQYVRDNAPVMQVDTSMQLPWRQALADGVAAWQQLPDSIKSIYQFRASVNKYKNSLNVPRSISGYNFYLRQYMLKYKAGVLPDNTLPTLNSGSRFRLESIDLQLNDILLNIDHMKNNSIGSQYSYFSIMASGPLSVKINYPAKQHMRHLGSFRFSGSSQVLSVLFLYESIFGPWSGGGQSKVFFGLQSFNYGSNYKSPYFYLSGINPNVAPPSGFPYVFPFNLS